MGLTGKGGRGRAVGRGEPVEDGRKVLAYRVLNMDYFLSHLDGIFKSCGFGWG